MKVLVAVASKHGSTYEIAEAIAEVLTTSGFHADVRSVDEMTSIDDYEAVILGSAIYAGSWLQEARRFTEINARKLADLPVWLFSSGPLGADNPQPAVDTAKIEETLANFPVREHKVFVGKLDMSKLSLAEKLITKAVRAPEGDFRDWQAIRAWSRNISAVLQTQPHSVG